VPLVYRNGELSTGEPNGGPHPDGVPQDGQSSGVGAYAGEHRGEGRGYGGPGIGGTRHGLQSMQRLKSGASFSGALAVAGGVHSRLTEDPYLGYRVASRIDLVIGPAMFLAYLITVIIIFCSN